MSNSLEMLRVHMRFLLKKRQDLIESLPDIDPSEYAIADKQLADISDTLQQYLEAEAQWLNSVKRSQSGQ